MSYDFDCERAIDTIMSWPIGLHMGPMDQSVILMYARQLAIHIMLKQGMTMEQIIEEHPKAVAK